MVRAISSKKVVKNKRIVILVSILVMVLAAVTSLIIYNSKKSVANETVVTINGEAVSTEEFRQVMSGLKANAFSYFVQKYGAKDSEKFWTTSYNGEIPMVKLKEKTLDKLKNIKIEQILMKENGIVKDISYAGFFKDFKDENERRKKAVENKEPIYGPTQYDEKSYYDILQGNRIEVLKNKLSSKELFVSDSEIKKFYEENKENLFKEAKTMEEAQPQIKEELINKKFNDIVNKRISEAKVIVNDKTLGKIK